MQSGLHKAIQEACKFFSQHSVCLLKLLIPSVEMTRGIRAQLLQEIIFKAYLIKYI